MNIVGSMETVGRQTGPQDETQPWGALLKVGRLATVSSWSSGGAGRSSGSLLTATGGVEELLKPPNGMATLLKHLYPGSSGCAKGSGIWLVRVSARAGSLMMACSQGER